MWGLDDSALNDAPCIEYISGFNTALDFLDPSIKMVKIERFRKYMVRSKMHFASKIRTNMKYCYHI